MKISTLISVRSVFLFVAGILLSASFASPISAQQSTPATLFLSPSSGTFVVGSTFTVSIFVNTGGQNINAVQADLRFPSDKLQVVSPSAGKSFVGIWVVQPTYDNRTGIIKFQGAIPTPGVTTSAGLISEITFRVISVGTALIRFEDSSRILLNDGKGTDVLGNTTGGVYNLALPPPAGPAVSSPTHQDQEKWYAARDVTLQWGSDEKVQGYSYVLSDQPVQIPDDIAEGNRTIQAYKNLGDAIHYFHIKALRSGSWGGVTHFSFKIDGTSPAHFKIEVSPSTKTNLKRPIINFQTTDALSGLDHYELKIISLIPSEPVAPQAGASAQGFFIEASSPYIPELKFGDYDVIVRAYDQAGNYVQEIERLIITSMVSAFVEREGLRISENIVIPWWVIWSIAIFAVIIAGSYAYHFWRWHRHVEERKATGGLPDEIKNKLEELRALREKYKGAIVILFTIGLGFMLLSFGKSVLAQERKEQIELSPPVTTEVSRNISNQEIFYIGGKSVVPEAIINIYLQSLETGETRSFTVSADKNGDWFYTNNRFLGSGQYLLWTQAARGELLSPPSSQIPLAVTPTAIQLGASRLSYEMLYLIISVALFVVVVGAGGFALYHRHHGRKKHAHIEEEIRKAEAMVHRGFAVLRRDIERELELIARAKASGKFGEGEREQEAKILKDLEVIQRYIGREIWEMEQDG